MVNLINQLFDQNTLVKSNCYILFCNLVINDLDCESKFGESEMLQVLIVIKSEIYKFSGVMLSR